MSSAIKPRRPDTALEGFINFEGISSFGSLEGKSQIRVLPYVHEDSDTEVFIDLTFVGPESTCTFRIPFADCEVQSLTAGKLAGSEVEAKYKDGNDTGIPKNSDKKEWCYLLVSFRSVPARHRIPREDDISALKTPVGQAFHHALANSEDVRWAYYKIGLAGPWETVEQERKRKAREEAESQRQNKARMLEKQRDAARAREAKEAWAEMEAEKARKRLNEVRSEAAISTTQSILSVQRDGAMKKASEACFELRESVGKSGEPCQENIDEVVRSLEAVQKLAMDADGGQDCAKSTAEAAGGVVIRTATRDGQS